MLANHVMEMEATMSSAAPSSGLLYFSERGSGPPLLVHGLMVTGEMFDFVLAGQLSFNAKSTASSSVIFSPSSQAAINAS